MGAGNNAAVGVLISLVAFFVFFGVLIASGFIPAVWSAFGTFIILLVFWFFGLRVERTRWFFRPNAVKFYVVFVFFVLSIFFWGFHEHSYFRGGFCNAYV